MCVCVCVCVCVCIYIYIYIYILMYTMNISEQNSANDYCVRLLNY